MKTLEVKIKDEWFEVDKVGIKKYPYTSYNPERIEMRIVEQKTKRELVADKLISFERDGNYHYNEYLTRADEIIKALNLTENE